MTFRSTALIVLGILVIVSLLSVALHQGCGVWIDSRARQLALELANEETDDAAIAAVKAELAQLNAAGARAFLEAHAAGDVEAQVRLETALAGMPELLPYIRSILKSQVSEAKLRVAAARSLGSVRDAAAGNQLMLGIESPILELRIACMDAIADIGYRRAAPIIRSRLQLASRWELASAARAAGLLKDEAAIADLERLARADFFVVRGTAISALAELDSKSSLFALKRLVNGADPNRQRQVILAIGRSRQSEAFSMLAEFARTGVDELRLPAIRAIAFSKHGKQQRVQVLRALTKSESATVRAASREALRIIARLP